MQTLATEPLFRKVLDGSPSPTGLPLTGEELRDSGIQSVLDHTPEQYKEKFVGVIKGFARGFKFTVEDVRARAGEPPAEVHQNCLGALMHNSARANLIAITNETRSSERTARRAGRLVVWRRL